MEIESNMLAWTPTSIEFRLTDRSEALEKVSSYRIALPYYRIALPYYSSLSTACVQRRDVHGKTYSRSMGAQCRLAWVTLAIDAPRTMLYVNCESTMTSFIKSGCVSVRVVPVS